MLNTFSCRLLFVVSLFLLSTSTQVFATEKSNQITNSIEFPEKININQANNHQLAVIKGIGNKKAQAIIQYREKNGDFVSIEDLIKVKGIGKETLQKITPFVSL